MLYVPVVFNPLPPKNPATGKRPPVPLRVRDVALTCKLQVPWVVYCTAHDLTGVYTNDGEGGVEKQPGKELVRDPGLGELAAEVLHIFEDLEGAAAVIFETSEKRGKQYYEALLAEAGPSIFPVEIPRPNREQ